MHFENDLAKIKKSDINLKEINLLLKRKDIIPWRYAHYREYCAFIFVTSGSFIARFNDKKFIIEKNEMIFVEKGCFFRSESRELPFEYYEVEFDFYNDSNLNFRFDNLYELLNPDKFLTIFENMYNVWQNMGTAYLPKLKMYMYELLSCLVNENIHQNENYSYKKIKKSIEYIEKNYLTEYINVETLAKLSDMSTSQYNRIFKSIFNATPTKYMNMQRIERACRLLSSTSLQIGEISDMCGFSNTYYFSKMFKESQGISPLKYRAKHFRAE